MSVDIKCTVNAKPAPKVIFWRDHDGRIPVILGNNYRMKIDNDTEVRDASRRTRIRHTPFLFPFRFCDFFSLSLFSAYSFLHFIRSWFCVPVLVEAIWWCIYERAFAWAYQFVQSVKMRAKPGASLSELVSIHSSTEFQMNRLSRLLFPCWFFPCLWFLYLRCKLRVYITRNY